MTILFYLICTIFAIGAFINVLECVGVRVGSSVPTWQRPAGERAFLLMFLVTLYIPIFYFLFHGMPR